MEVPFKYLGMIIGGNPRKTEFWNPIVNKIKSRLSRWRVKLLSMAGQICLIKFVISALPLFYFSFFKAPIAVCNQIRRIQARFLWGWGFEQRKIAWVKWEKVCSPVAAGGLGIKDIGCFNDALLTKWKWRFVAVEEGLWRDILEARYGSWRNMNISLEHRNQSLWWKDLCQTCGKGIQSNLFDCRSKWILGDGRCVKFWEDRWAEDRVLK